LYCVVGIVCIRLVCPMLPVSLDCPSFVAPTVAQYFVFSVVLCISVFLLVLFILWPLYWPSIYDFWLPLFGMFTLSIYWRVHLSISFKIYVIMKKYNATSLEFCDIFSWNSQHCKIRQT
jgi:hypothetical protein